MQIQGKIHSRQKSSCSSEAEVVEFEPEAPMEVQEDANFNVEVSMASDQDIKVEVDEAGEEVKKGND